MLMEKLQQLCVTWYTAMEVFLYLRDKIEWSSRNLHI